MCFICVSASRQNGEHPNHIESSLLDDATAQTTYQALDSSAAPADVQALLLEANWVGGFGQSATITYSFNNTYLPAYKTALLSDSAFTASQQAAVRDVFDMISSFANIHFFETSSSSADMHFYTASLAYFYGYSGITQTFPGADDKSDSVTVGIDHFHDNFVPGSGDYWVLLHEIGHAVGLKHPGNYSNGAEPGPYLPSHLDNLSHTVMSYNKSGAYPTNYRPLDIEAIQYIYGAQNSNDSKQMSIFDDVFAGGLGSDTITGSVSRDTIYGGRERVDVSDASDVIYGGGGADSVMGNAGNDTIYGGGAGSSTSDGGDTIWGGQGTDVIYGNAGNDQLGGGGNVYAPNDSGDFIQGGDGDDEFTGNGGNDTIYGDDVAGTSGTGNDSIHGGVGDDIIVASGGNDTINGGVGNDTMTGGVGSDTFIFHGGSGIDVITDFEVGVDDLVFSAPADGIVPTSVAELLASVTQSGSNLVIDFGDGNMVTLHNVGAITAADLFVYN